MSWPQRGDRVVLTRGPDPVEIDVLGVHVVAQGRLAFVRGFPAGGPYRAGTHLIEATDWHPADEPELIRPYVQAAG